MRGCKGESVFEACIVKSLFHTSNASIRLKLFSFALTEEYNIRRTHTAERLTKNVYNADTARMRPPVRDAISI